MSMIADDKAHAPRANRSSRMATGLGFALLSAATFGMSGALARGLLDTGWTPGSVVLARITIAALVVAPFGIRALRGRWHLLRAAWRTVLIYGLVAVAATQFFYFSAVSHMEVGPALLIEYTAPAAIVVWLWLRHGERPSPITLVGAGVAGLGLILVLDLLSGAELSLVGVAWALAAMVGCAIYFVLSADEGNGLPPIALAASGMVIGATSLAILGAVGVLAMGSATTSVVLAGRMVEWWVPVLLLGVVTAAVAYVAGIAASRRLGSRLASFVALVEVVFGVLWAWVLLDELPRFIQLVGGVLILAGVVAVKLGERSVVVAAADAPESAA
jgi:drug/metabolite transporter (DMT)-like permease